MRLLDIRKGLLALCILALAVPALAEMRTWTSLRGSTVEAEFVEQELDTVVLRTAEGELLDIRLNQLSADDQLYVGSLRNVQHRNEPEASSDTDAAIVEIVGTRLVNARGSRMAPDVLEEKTVGLYFSAGWCPPCRAFTPRLVEAYETLKAESKPFEIVFVSHDRSERDMLRYMRDYNMPWSAIRFDQERREQLKQEHNIRGIPALVILDQNGKRLSAEGYSEVSAHGAAAFEQWQ